jgi:hypothetical protein
MNAIWIIKLIKALLDLWAEHEASDVSTRRDT